MGRDTQDDVILIKEGVVGVVLLRQLRDDLHRGVHLCVHVGLALLATLGGDEDDAVGTFHTIDSGGGGILQHGDALHGGDVDGVHRTLNAIDEHQRVAVVP